MKFRLPHYEMRVFEKEWLRRILRRKEGESNKRGWCKLREELDHKLYSSKNICVNKLNRMRLTGKVGCMKLTKHTYKDLVGKSEKMRDLCTPTCKQEDNITKDLTEIVCAIAN
jgi:hypothetical protein